MQAEVLPRLTRAEAAAERAYRAGAISYLEWAQLQSECTNARKQQLETTRFRFAHTGEHHDSGLGTGKQRGFDGTGPASRWEVTRSDRIRMRGAGRGVAQSAMSTSIKSATSEPTAR